MKLQKGIKAFSLIEILVWIMIISIVIIWWFQSLTAVTIWKVRIIQQTDIQKESFYFTEKLFEMIKKWGTLDYEEYFNRSIIWNSTYSGHFDKPSWFWNFWSWLTLVPWTDFGWGFYYCISDIGTKMWTGWCVDNPNFNSATYDFSSDQQRYWEYSFQFIDYNSNKDSDYHATNCPTWIKWDENCDWNIINDDDDEYLWNWPEVFNAWEIIPELYLISWYKNLRTLFRWSVKLDINAWWNLCDIENATWSWCIWTVEYLKLEWRDFWMDHDDNLPDSTQYDWVNDTWLIHSDFQWWGDVAWISDINWVSLFPETINVTEFNVRAYPNKDLWLAWNSDDISLNVSPYVIVNLKLKPSWQSRSKIKWEWKELDFSMTINLSEIYSQ